MGLAMARQLLAAGHSVIGLSRQINPTLDADAAAKGATLQQWPVDLADAPAAAAQLATWLREQAPDAFASATLINNAGVIPRIGPLSDANATDLARALRVGLEAPMALAAAFLGATAHWRGPRKVLNISSGLGRRAMASQAAYCAAKAGMDHFTRCLALDEALKPHGAKVCSLAPGVIETDMQVQLRGADAAAFPDRAAVTGMKEQGQLATPENAAARVLAWLNRPDFGANPVADVRD
jgi:benzil reductase ((S)-benzoin forming)